MKSIRVHEHGPPEVMVLEDISDPQPGTGEVVVQVHAAGVNPVDTYIRSGLHGYTANLPYTPGIDAAGIIESVGYDVTAPEQSPVVMQKEPCAILPMCIRFLNLCRLHKGRASVCLMELHTVHYFNVHGSSRERLFWSTVQAAALVWRRSS